MASSQIDAPTFLAELQVRKDKDIKTHAEETIS